MTLPRPYSRRGCTASLDFDREAASNGHGSQCCIGVVSLPLSAKGGVLAASRQARLGRDGVAGPLCVERLLCLQGLVVRLVVALFVWGDSGRREPLASGARGCRVHAARGHPGRVMEARFAGEGIFRRCEILRGGCRTKTSR